MAYSLSARENYLLALNHKPHEYTPGGPDSAIAGMFVPIERGEGGSGIDAFGVRWVAPTSAAGGALPAPGEFMLTDVTEWKKVIKIPDLSVYDWESYAAMEEPTFNRDTQVIEVFSSNCIYERLATFMGFEGALIAMATEPEATFELLSALTDFKIEMLKYYAKYYKPDTYIFFDDVATERSLFMSPDTYRSLIKPLHTKLCKASYDCGIIPIQHTCGKADSLVQDMIDEGCAGWHAVQATNDIEEIIQKYGDDFMIIGGYNSNGPPGLETATEAEIRAEVRRCMDSYGKYGKGYVFSGFMVSKMNQDDPLAPFPGNLIINDEFLKIRKENEK